MNHPDSFKTVPCPICSSLEFDIIYKGNFPSKLSEEFLMKTYRSSSDQKLFEQVVQCTHCNVVYLNPRLSASSIVEAYAEGEDPGFISQDSMRVRTFTKALRRLSNQYQIPLIDTTKLLDIGCAAGAFLRAAQILGLSVIGLEPNKWMSEYAQRTHGLDVRSGTLSDHVFSDAEFDIVSLWDVIEHVPDPAKELREIHRILKRDGLLVVNYPDFGSMPARVLGRKWPFLLSVHLTYYTPQTITKQLTEAGFTVLDIQKHWQTLELGYVLHRMIPYFSFIRFIKKAVEFLGIARLPIKYWIGQTRVVAKRC